MKQEEILDIMEACPWRERLDGPYVCARFINQYVPCNGACSWIVDYQKQKELETKKHKL